MLFDFVIAVDRAHRATIDPAWQERVSQIRDLSIVGQTAARLLVKATDTAIEGIRSAFGDQLVIERTVSHRAS